MCASMWMFNKVELGLFPVINQHSSEISQN